MSGNDFWVFVSYANKFMVVKCSYEDIDFRAVLTVFLFFCTVMLVLLFRIPRYLLHLQPWNRHSKQEENERRGKKNLNAVFLFFLFFRKTRTFPNYMPRSLFTLLISQNHITCLSLLLLLLSNFNSVWLCVTP